MKLFNTIIVWDVYTAAESPEAARAAALLFIQDEKLPPSEQTAIDVRDAKEIRAAWQKESPIVGADVSDEDFAKLKGKTTVEAYELIHTRKGSQK